MQYSRYAGSEGRWRKRPTQTLYRRRGPPRTLIAVGISEVVVAVLCCIAPFLLSGIMTAIGLGLILKDSILIGLLIVFIGMAGLGLFLAPSKG